MDRCPLNLQGKTLQSALERQFMAEYLKVKGYELEEISSYPKAQVRRLLAEASLYASLKLAEIESRSNFLQKIS